MNLKQRATAFAKVGLFIKEHYTGTPSADTHLHEGLNKVTELAYIHNGWFTPKFVNHAIANVGTMLNEKELYSFCENKQANKTKTVAVICAGNIPMVGFHDIMCILLTGHKALIKLSADDDVLLPFFLKLLVHYEPEFEQYIYFSQGRLSAFDAIIATGSNNTAGYFEFYFGKYPNIIRKNRTSIAVLTGNETTAQLKALGDDIFLYFGLGCRNVSKLLVPEGYNFNSLFESIVDYGYVVENKKYGNNYEYHRSIYLLEQHKFLDNNFLMIKESEGLHSPVGTLYYSYYKSKNGVEEYLKSHEAEIQCIIGEGRIPFGYSQRPVITDFADNVNTLDFLVTL